MVHRLWSMALRCVHCYIDCSTVFRGVLDIPNLTLTVRHFGIYYGGYEYSF